MKTTNPISNILKGISLIILDVITLLIVFSGWAIINVPLFPWALMTILFSLFTVNVIIGASYNGIRSMGFPSYVSIISTTVLYYLSIMIYTGAVYAAATTRGYLITVLIITLIYFAVTAGLFCSATSHKADMGRQEAEKNQGININLRLMEINDAIIHSNNSISKEQYEGLVDAFKITKERLLASTPVGRVTKPIVLEMDSKLNAMLLMIYDNITSLNKESDVQNLYDIIIRNLSDLKTLIINREKLIVQ